VALAASLGAQSAWADVDVTATIQKTKTISVTEQLYKYKEAFIFVRVDSAPDKAAESLAVVNQSNYDNEACENCAERTDELINSVNAGNAGIVALNQASGNMNNQGNNLAVAVDVARGTPGGPPPGGGPNPEQFEGNGFAEAQASTDQKNGAYNILGEDNVTVTGVGFAPNVVDAINLLFRDALISGSINNNDGVVMVNQAPGNMNNQANNLALAVSFAENSGVALSEADLGQLTTGNTVRESGDGLQLAIGINKSARITGSLSDNTGIVAANQATGNMSNQSNTLAMAVVILN
jgi:hypothetical protein